MPRIALGLEYDGSAFCGWQSQTTGATVQDAVERALAQVCGGMAVRCHCAGRTDTGVHAIGQVIHFDPPVGRPVTAWVRGVNAHLPAGVAVNWAQPVAADFHARFSATARAYRYLLLNRPQRPGLNAHRVGWYHRPLSLDIMQAAAAHLAGRHDFSAFRSAQCQARSPVRNLSLVRLARHSDMLVFDFVADGFLHHMIRNIVGALVHVGSGGHEAGWLGYLLAQRDRRLAPPTFSAAGLYFSGVEYDARFALPAKVIFGGTALIA